tara:strand:+ start:252 stop:1199 length:948 start_codon:yes stop_codon:yes gene_type:complete
MDKIMIVDMLNMYYRAYIVDPSLSSNGQPIGGIKGSLKILQKLCREIKPTRVYICWDGREGSSKRRKTNSSYKEGRKPIRLNRNVRILSEEEELKNKIWQQLRLAEYMNSMPISQIMVDYTEADDVIAALCNYHKSDYKVIVSSDKDFFQLLDDTTVLYRPVQKEVLNKKSIVKKFGIHPRNFALARAICGDRSDNLGGIKGAGLKTIAKRFSFLSEDKDYTLQDLKDACDNTENKLKIHSDILESEKLISENYKIMQLYAPPISIKTADVIKSNIKDYPKQFSKTQIRKMMLEDGFAELNWNTLFAHMNKINRS